MDNYKPITKEEAMQYDRDSVAAEIEKRERNLSLFQDESQHKQEEREIQRLYQIIAIIDANK